MLLQLVVLASASLAAGDSPSNIPAAEEAPPSPLLRGLAGGAAYGLVAAAISHPFDTIKTRSQAGMTLRSARSLFDTVLGVYRGILPATLASVCFRTVPFIGYEATTSLLRHHHILDTAPLAVAFLGGAAGGVMRGCLETPAELIKTRLQLRAVWTAPMLLRGLYSTCLRNSFVIGLYWVFFEATKPVREAHLSPVASSFAAGGGCSVLAWAAIYPLDTAKSRIQASASSSGVFQQLASIYRLSGVRGWYAGLAPGLTRAFLANGGGMVMYDLIQRHLKAKGRGGKSLPQADDPVPQADDPAEPQADDPVEPQAGVPPAVPLAYDPAVPATDARVEL